MAETASLSKSKKQDLIKTEGQTQAQQPGSKKQKLSTTTSKDKSASLTMTGKKANRSTTENIYDRVYTSKTSSALTITDRLTSKASEAVEYCYSPARPLSLTWEECVLRGTVYVCIAEIVNCCSCMKEYKAFVITTHILQVICWYQKCLTTT